jgi:hypothetical protein
MICQKCKKNNKDGSFVAHDMEQKLNKQFVQKDWFGRKFDGLISVYQCPHCKNIEIS